MHSEIVDLQPFVIRRRPKFRFSEAWCSVAPRGEYASLNRSPVLKPLDEVPVWSIVCFYVAKSHRRQGVLEALIRAAVEYVGERGGRIVMRYHIGGVSESAS